MLTSTFEAHAQKTESGVEYWLARDVQFLLGYTEWRNFVAVIVKAKTACEGSGSLVTDHFVDVNKTIQMPNSAEKEIPDIMLTRYACYLVAQNGDPKKTEIAFAQTYFAVQTRRAERIEQRLLEVERISGCQKLSATEKDLSKTIFEQTGGNRDFVNIRSKGDHSLFGKTTISNEHITNNQAVRKTLVERGIRPETLPAAEDVKKGERRHAMEEKSRSNIRTPWGKITTYDPHGEGTPHTTRPTSGYFLETDKMVEAKPKTRFVP
jgi:DNA-damage-inducible protein D